MLLPAPTLFIFPLRPGPPHDRLAGLFFPWQSSVFPSPVASLLGAAAPRPTFFTHSPRGLGCLAHPPVPSQRRDPTASRPSPSALPPLSFPPHPGWGAVPGQGREVQEQRPCPVPPPVREWPRKGGVCFSMSHVPPRSCLIPSEQRPGVRPPSAWPSGGGSRCPEPAPGCTTLLFTLALFLSTAC